MIVMVSSFPPMHDGIARYTLQQVQALRERGEKVLTIGRPGTEADVNVDFFGGFRALRLAKYFRSADRVIIQWHDQYFYRGGGSGFIPTSLTLIWMFWRFPKIEIVCHEAFGLDNTGFVGLQKRVRALSRWLCQRTWRAAPLVCFHSEPERRNMEKRVGVQLDDRRVRYIAHGDFFRKLRDVDRQTARRELGIDPDRTVFLCVGFIAPHKGFHRALSAFAQLPPDSGAMFYIVGSPHPDSPVARQYVDQLKEQVDRVPNSFLVEDFVDDQAFDTWIAAADVVITPYAAAFSSGVVERAKLFNVFVIASAVGGLPAQLQNHGAAFDSDAQLLGLMTQRVRNSPRAVAAT